MAWVATKIAVGADRAVDDSVMRHVMNGDKNTRRRCSNAVDLRNEVEDQTQ